MFREVGKTISTFLLFRNMDSLKCLERLNRDKNNELSLLFCLFPFMNVLDMY